MNIYTFSFLFFFSAFSLLTLSVQAAYRSSPTASDESSPVASSPGKRAFHELCGIIDEEPNSKSPTILSPMSANFLIGGTSHMEISNKVSGASKFIEAKEDNSETEAFIALNSSSQSSSESPRRFALEFNRKIAPNTLSSSRNAHSSLDKRCSTASRVINSVVQPAVVKNDLAMVKKQIIRPETSPVSAAPALIEQSAVQVPSIKIDAASISLKMNNDFWLYIHNGHLNRVYRMLKYDPKFIPVIDDACFTALAKVMCDPDIDEDILKFLYGKFPVLFQSRYPNGKYIYHISHPNNIRTLLEVFINDRDLRISLFDEMVNTPLSPLVLDDCFFNFILNNDVLFQFMYNTNPGLFLVDYRQLSDGAFKRALPIMLTKLARFYPHIEAIQLAYFKLSAVDSSLPFDRSILDNIHPLKLIKIIEFLRTVPADQVSQIVLGAVYQIPNIEFKIRLPNGCNPLSQAIAHNLNDIVEIIMSASLNTN